jgi:hypothetical protein
VISGFRRDVTEICALLEYYAAMSGSSVPTFRDNLSVPSSRVKKANKKVFFLVFLTLEDGTDSPETSVQNYQRCVIPHKRSDHLQAAVLGSDSCYIYIRNYFRPSCGAPKLHKLLSSIVWRSKTTQTTFVHRVAFQNYTNSLRPSCGGPNLHKLPSSIVWRSKPTQTTFVHRVAFQNYTNYLRPSCGVPKLHKLLSSIVWRSKTTQTQSSIHKAHATASVSVVRSRYMNAVFSCSSVMPDDEENRNA